MPQGRRKVPFSGKAKKEQLKNKKMQKNEGAKTQHFLKRHESDSETSSNESNSQKTYKMNFQPTKSGHSSDKNRFVLEFHRETDAELKQMKEKAYKEIEKVNEEDLELKAENFFVKELDFPKRPPWNFNISKEQLDANEHRYFLEYLKKIDANFDRKDLGYFELNLETWRQLWRVIEISDMLLFIVDIRFASAMFPPSLYEYITKDLKKSMILILNKIDLVQDNGLIVAWLNYFKIQYPNLHIILFTTLPIYNLRSIEQKEKKLITRRKKGKMRMASEGALKLYETCQLILNEENTNSSKSVNLSSWHAKILEEMEKDNEGQVEVGKHIVLDKHQSSTDYFETEKYKDGILTIGCVGQPNVGKSSIMNALMGRKVVSISRTPGHTKHFQTIYLTENVRLCDCPGLVFPSKVPKTLQVLMGEFPIAQLRQPYGAVTHIAERIDLVKLLNLKHPSNEETWSTMDICEAWAIKRGYMTAKANRPDVYRSANSLLRMQLEGKFPLCFYPPNYTKEKGNWANHPDNEMVKWIKADKNEMENDSINVSNDSSTEDTSESVSSESEGGDCEDTAPIFKNQFNKFALLQKD